MAEKAITVADLDAITPNYCVCNEHGCIIGKKIHPLGSDQPMYLKPEYDAHGQHIGPRNRSIEDLTYRVTPPWFKFEVIKIAQVQRMTAFYTRKNKKTKGK